MFTVHDGQIVFDPCATDELLDAVIISLYCNRRVQGYELEDDRGDLGGYWGDLLGGPPNLGSKLWLLSRRAQTEVVLEEANGYALAALQWLKDQTMVEEIAIKTSFHDERILLEICLDTTHINLAV